jgi:anaerobic magnesium-protoporphyrin IX monomethyl ester cyclase
VDGYFGGSKQKSNLTNLKGVAYRNGQDQIVINPPQDLIVPLDSIPFPVMEGKSPPYIFSSRGCPYRCSFCSSTRFWKKLRFFSSDYVVSQVEHIKSRFRKHKLITFWDDLVISDRKRFVEIVDKLEARGLMDELRFGFAVRAELIDEEMCAQIGRLKIAFISFGAESGNDRVLKLLKGNSASTAKNQKALDLLKKLGIPVMCGFIIGAPTETEEEMQDTFDFIFRNTESGKLNEAVVNILMPLPGTAMWDYGLEKGILKYPIDWNRLRIFANYKTSNIGGLTEWIDQRLKNKTYYLNDDYVPHERLLEKYYNFELKLAEYRKGPTCP